MIAGKRKQVVITGGAGYVGSALVPYLIDHGWSVKVLDLFLYGEECFKQISNSPHLICVKGDIRNVDLLMREIAGADAVIHLACISNDPSFELNPELGKSINYDAFFGLLEAVRAHKISRFIYASSSSVYGVQTTPDVRENCERKPLTDYSKFKALCEDHLIDGGIGGGCFTILRPATVCGYAPRLRLDLTVNVLTISALERNAIRVFGGSQLRPNINIQDMIEAYRLLLDSPEERINGKIFNAGYQNFSVSNIADIVQQRVGDRVSISTEPSDDLRSYHINSDKIADELGFRPQSTIEDAVDSIVAAYRSGMLENPLDNPLYYNIKLMQSVAI